MKYLIILLMFAGCSSTPKVPYQNNFWLGCMTAYLHFQQNMEVETKIKKIK